MPYVLVRGNLAPLRSSQRPWRVLISGLKAHDILELERFDCGGFKDDSYVYFQHPNVILCALEVIGFRVVASTSIQQQDHIEYMWTMRREFTEPEPPLETK